MYHIAIRTISNGEFKPHLYGKHDTPEQAISARNGLLGITPESPPMKLWEFVVVDELFNVVKDITLPAPLLPEPTQQAQPQPPA